MKCNYLIKYAAMPIIEQVESCCGSNVVGYDRNVACYIVSKCYLLSESTVYFEDGNISKNYVVVFPYQLNSQCIFERNTPQFNLNNVCINSKTVNSVFDSYEEALKYTEEVNNQLWAEACSRLTIDNNNVEQFKEQIYKEKQDFYAKIANYKLLEKQILSETNDLVLNKNNKLDKLIRLNGNKFEILHLNLYDALNFFDFEKFIVYSVTKEIYDKLIHLTQKQEIEDALTYVENVDALLVNNPKDSMIRIVNEDIAGSYYLCGNDLCYSDKFEKLTKEQLQNIDEYQDIFYTTENFEDIINSYKKYDDIKLTDIKTHVLKKV